MKARKSTPSRAGSSSAQLALCGRALSKKMASDQSTSAILKKMLERLEAYCGEKKLNWTEAREKILETIVLEARHFTALDLLEYLRRRHPEIGKATVYRNLSILVDSGVLQKGPMDFEGQNLYELADDDHHDHIVCLDCRGIFEFHDESIEARQEKIANDMRFTLQGHRHVVFATCNLLTNRRAKNA